MLKNFGHSELYTGRMYANKNIADRNIERRSKNLLIKMQKEINRVKEIKTTVTLLFV